MNLLLCLFFKFIVGHFSLFFYSSARYAYFAFNFFYSSSLSPFKLIQVVNLLCYIMEVTLTSSHLFIKE
jgi:hypothetical protein